MLLKHTRLIKRIALLLLCLSHLLVAEVAAQTHEIQKRERTPGERPKIGLVLSGGGAKGLAHIGVLKAIDRSGLHIDYIAGTSMGAIVAAMYACGYSADQIEQVSRETNWMKLISSKPSFEDIGIEDRDEFENYIFRLPMKGIKPQLTTGIFEPYQVKTRLREVFFPVSREKDFSKLDIPFKCIATDIGSGDAVVLDGGDLAFATRSSMAIPGVFSATEYNGTKLVDGGIVRNFPVRDVIEMGADYVIGVNLFSGLTPADELGSMLDVMLQITNFRDAKDLEEEKAACDMLIEPSVGAYSAASFESADTILTIGDEIGLEFEPLFKQLAASLHNAYGVPYSTPDRMKAYDPQVRVVGFEFEGLKSTTENQIKHALNIHAGVSYSPADFSESVKSAMSTGFYSNVDYELKFVDDYTSDVIFCCKVHENPLASLGLSLSYNTFTNASILLNYQIRNIFKHVSLTDFKVAVSKDFRVWIRNRTLFGVKGDHFLDVEFANDRFYIPSYRDVESTDNSYVYVHNNISVGIGHAFSTVRDTKFSIGWEDFYVSPTSSSVKDIDGHARNFYFNGRMRVNTFDKKYLATRGKKFDLNAYVAAKPWYHYKKGATLDSLKANGLDDDKVVARATARLEMRQAATDRLTFTEVVGGAVGFRGKSFVHQTALGGPTAYLPSHLNFYGLVTANRFAPTMLMVGLSGQYNLVADVHLLLHLNSAVTFEGLESYIVDKNKFEAKEFIHGGGISLAYNLLGMLPLDFTLMYGSKDKFNVSVNIGHYF